MGFFKDDLKKVRAFIFDVDGVLSLATQNLTPEGELVRTSCTKDGYAIMYSLRKGYIIAVISGGGAPGVRERLAVSTVRDTKTGKIYIKMVNLLNHPVKGKLKMEGFEDLFKSQAERTVRLHLLTGAYDDTQARPQVKDMTISQEFEYELPAYSFSLVEI